jgi:iron complex transport system substrate-binding protein
LRVFPTIVSLLPSATEMICALGLIDQLVGVTHECDFPPSVRDKTKVVRPALPIATMSDRESDEAVARRIGSGLGLYLIDASLIQALRPDIIVTQSLCEVCAPSEHEMAQLLAELDYRPRILFQSPHRISDIFQCLQELSVETRTEAMAERLIGEAQARLDRVETVASRASRRPRVFCMEWLDPVYCSGHWVPEMVRLAGGEDLLGRAGEDSIRIAWEQVHDWDPEILVFMPCGFDLHKTLQRTPALAAIPGFHALTAVRKERVYAVDANAYFARPGPRLVDGTELMAHLIHPELLPWNGSPVAYSRLRPTIFGRFKAREAPCVR